MHFKQPVESLILVCICMTALQYYAIHPKTVQWSAAFTNNPHTDTQNSVSCKDFCKQYRGRNFRTWTTLLIQTWRQQQDKPLPKVQPNNETVTHKQHATNLWRLGSIMNSIKDGSTDAWFGKCVPLPQLRGCHLPIHPLFSFPPLFPSSLPPFVVLQIRGKLITLGYLDSNISTATRVPHIFSLTLWFQITVDRYLILPASTYMQDFLFGVWKKRTRLQGDSMHHYLSPHYFLRKFDSL